MIAAALRNRRRRDINEVESVGMRLFCFPYAGGRAAVYHELEALLPGIEMHAVELPGHGLRLGEPLLSSMEALTDLLLRELDSRFERPFAFYGHSLGAAIAYELACRLPAGAQARLRHLFLSGCRAPEHIERAKAWHRLDDDGLLAILRELGGTPREVLDSRELMRELVMPIMRADLAVIECYEPAGAGVLPVDITAFAGRDDGRAPPGLVGDWRRRSGGAFALHILEGGHFFPWQALPAVAAVLREKLDAAEAAQA